MNISRKQLLVAGAGAALLPATSLAAATNAAPPRASFVFDEARFNAILAKPARHRQCCASARIADGAVFDAMTSTMYAYEFDLGEGPGTVNEVAVFYHQSGALLGLGDATWRELVIPALPHFDAYLRSEVAGPPHPLAGMRGKASTGNPYLHREAHTRLEDDMSIEALASRGCHFFVCNNALLGLSDVLAAAFHERSDVIHRRLLADLVPNAMAVPAGVMAINACQEAHFTYLQAAL